MQEVDEKYLSSLDDEVIRYDSCEMCLMPSMGTEKPPEHWGFPRAVVCVYLQCQPQTGAVLMNISSLGK